MRMKRFRVRFPNWARRRVVVVILVACTLLGIGASTASAVTAPPAAGTTSCNGQQLSAPEALLVCLLGLANSSDFQPKDMKVAAPSSVIAATMTTTPNTSAPESPTKRVAEVNRWRPNPQAWIDAKTRVAGATGVSSRDVAQTARWQPKLTPGTVPVGKMGTSLLKGGAGMLAFAAVDNLLVPGLESGLGLDGVINSYWCSQRAAGKIDLTSYLVVDDADCVGWQAAQDAALELDASTDSMHGAELCYPGGCYVLKVVTNAWIEFQKYGYTAIASARGVGQICYTRTGSANGAYVFVADLTRPGGGVKQVAASLNGGSWAGSCDFAGGDLYGAFVGGESWPSGSYAMVQSLRLVDNGTGQAVASVDAAPGPAEWITQVKCLDGSIRYAVSAPFDFEAGGMMPEPAAVDLTGCSPVETSVGVQDAGTGISGWQDSRKVGGEMVPSQVQDWMRDFPDCWDGSCLLELRKEVGTGELDCFQVPEQCLNWYEESQAAPERYKCYYGGQLVALTECLVYTRVFDREKVQQGTGYADPATGAAPSGQTGTTQTTNPGAAMVAMQDPVKDPSSSRQCWPTGWAAFNPFEWVLQPVKCALEWAFVPKQSAFNRFTSGLQARFSQTSFGAVAGIVAALEIPGIGDGCTGPPLSFKYGEIDESWYPFAACQAPMSAVAATVKTWLGFVISGAAIFAIVRYVTAIVGFVPYGGSGSTDSGRRGPRFEAVDD